MKNKRYTQPNTSISLLKEKMGTLIERDILFTALLMAVGLLYTDGGFIRGLPFPWFITGPGIPTHYRPDTFLASLVCCALIVVFLEFINAVIRAATEPKAFSNISGKSAVYANTFDDNDEFRYEASEPKSYQYNYSGAQKSFDFKDATNYKKALRKNERAARKAASSIGGSKQNKGSGSNANIRPLTMFILIFTISTIIIIFAFAATMFRFSDIFDDDRDSDTDTGNSKGYTTIYDSPFYTEEGYLADECDDVIEMLIDQDEEGISDIGNGDASAMISILDWSNADYSENTRSIREIEPQEAFIRYNITADDKEYMFAIKFSGDDIAENPKNAVVTGITVCPYDPWDKYFEGDSADYTWSDFNDDIEKYSISIGDDRYYSYSMLTW